MKSLFDQEAYDEVRSRLNALSENSERQWGKMTPSQMLCHCQSPLHIILEKKDYGLKPNWLIKTFFKKSMYNDKPWPKNLPTVPGMKQTEPKDFNEEKGKLEDLLEELHNQRERKDWQPHPTFGTLTQEQWGKMQYKHLDHHLTQFGV
jgi:hypothetical protein